MSKQIHILRQQMRQARRALSNEQQQMSAEKVTKSCVQLPLYNKAKHIALYLPNDGEVSTHLLIEHCWEQGKKVVLPVLHPFTPGHLLFVEYTPNTKMRSNHYGIAEPMITVPQICPLANIDIIFTPLVAFDESGNRLGMGGGFYDRTLAPIRRDNLQCQLIGLAHDCQKTPRLDRQMWDVPLDMIITPTEILKTLY